MGKVTRRSFLKISAALGAAGGLFPLGNVLSGRPRTRAAGKGGRPVVVSTWRHGLAANDAAWRVLDAGGSALDAVEAGVRVPEGDPEVMSVGYGGRPDEECRVTLDASIMGPDGNAGAVAFVQGYKHPISIARKVMEETDHVMLVGAGAEEFARRLGFERVDLVTDEAKRVWRKWKGGLSDMDDWLPPEENHDTIGMVALDGRGDLSGACTTSGLAFKIHGRVGDSPIIGAGLYVDNEIGAASATGKGEAVIKACGSFLVVELMREGLSPEEACSEALGRIIGRHGGEAGFQVAFVALNKAGEAGACSIEKGFEYAIARTGANELKSAKHIQ
jgi:L-asparaginase/N4-(beta-N-acetylglucosaminyl)-L-asparaginase